MLGVSGNGVDCDDAFFCLAGERGVKICSAFCGAESSSCRTERAAQALLVAFKMQKVGRAGGMEAPEGWK